MNHPNILIMMCDQLNAGVLGCYGGPVPTPNIDRLAREGVLFTSVTCPTPYCSPTRASMITGLYPHTHGINYNVNRRDYPAFPSPETEEGIRNSDITTEKLLSAAGYQTHHYGKWHLLDEDLSYYPDMFREHDAYAAVMRDRFVAARDRPRESWIDWYGWAVPVTRSDRFQQAVRARGHEWDTLGHAEFVTKFGRLDWPPEWTFDHMVATKAVEALERLDTRPFMLTCSFNWPHDPNVVPSPYYEMFDPDEIELPANWGAIENRYETQLSRQIVTALGEAGAREFMRIYHACVKLIDDQVGRVLDALERSGRAADTLVLFTADHGDMCGGHGMVWKSTDAFYEEVARVPLIVWHPAEIRPGTLDIPCNLTDVMPTLLDFAGQPIPDRVEGTSLVPYLRGEGPPGGAPYAFSERLPANPGRRRLPVDLARGNFMIRGREWKYCRYADGDEMLFHLKGDPGETANLAGEPAYQDVKSELQRRLDAWLREAPNCSDDPARG